MTDDDNGGDDVQDDVIDYFQGKMLQFRWVYYIYFSPIFF
jgi:hypothetical protein